MRRCAHRTICVNVQIEKEEAQCGSFGMTEREWRIAPRSTATILLQVVKDVSQPNVEPISVPLRTLRVPRHILYHRISQAWLTGLPTPSRPQRSGQDRVHAGMVHEALESGVEFVRTEKVYGTVDVASLLANGVCQHIEHRPTSTRRAQGLVGRRLAVLPGSRLPSAWFCGWRQQHGHRPPLSDPVEQGGMAAGTTVYP